jgi:hypothetical protein
MDALNVVLVALATWQVTEVLHHAEITLPVRRWTAGSIPMDASRSFFSRGFNCPFCLAHWVAALLLFLLALDLEGAPHCTGLRYAIWLFAAVRLANLGNDVFYTYTRTPRFEVEEDDITVEDGEGEAGDEDDSASDLRR